MISKNPQITQIVMAEKLNISTRAVKKNIKDLVELEILRRVGTARKGYWEIKSI